MNTPVDRVEQRGEWAALRLCAAVLLFFGCLGLRILLEPILGSQYPFMFFFPAVVGAAWLAGFSGGLVVTLFATVAVWFWWMPSVGFTGLTPLRNGAHLAIFAGISAVLSYFVGDRRRALRAWKAAQQREESVRQHYEVTLRSIGDAVIATDEKLGLVFMNRAAEDLTGWTAREVVGRDLGQVFHLIDETTRQARPCSAREALQRGQATRLENHTLLVASDGREIPIAHRAAPILESEGTVRGAVVIFHDVREQVAARHALQNANEQLQQQVADLRRLHELSWHVFSTEDLSTVLGEILGAALDVNRTDKGLLSLIAPEREELKVAASAGFSAEFLQTANRIPLGRGPCSQCYLKRQRVVVEDVRTDPLYEPLHAAAAAAGFVSVHSTPLITRRGRLLGVLSIHFSEVRHPTEREKRLMDLYARNAADVIENVQLRRELEYELEVRRAAEGAVQQTNERFRLATFGDGLTLFEQDANLRYVWMYPEREEFIAAIGRTDAEILGEGGDDVVALKREVLSGGTLRRAEVGLEVTGKKRHFDLTIVPKRDPRRGLIIGVAGAALDITDRKQVEQELRRTKDELARANSELERRVAERTAALTDMVAQMDSFSYSISHDLRSPLRAITGYAQALQEDWGRALPPEASHLVERVILGGQRMSRLIDGVLAYSRISRDQIACRPVSLDGIVTDILQNTPELQPESAEVRVAAPLGSVLADESSLTQILSNLLGNAAKFVPAGRRPRIRVEAECRPRVTRIWIRDNGVGIAPEEQHRLFSLFERLQPRERYEGNGIGLAIVRRAAERMGGTVGVESDGINGSSFWVDLPGVAAATVSLTSETAGLAG